MPVLPWLGAPSRFAVTATGTPASSVRVLGALPSGLSFDEGSDTISGSAGLSALGAHTVTVVATSPAGTTSQRLRILVGTVPGLLTPQRARFVVGDLAVFDVVASGMPAPRITETGPLPAGVHLRHGRGFAELVGTPSPHSARTWHLELTTSNGIGPPVRQRFLLVVAPAGA